MKKIKELEDKIKRLNKQNTYGITLIALVITIIILIILAGISLNFVLGEDSIISTAAYAREKNEIYSIQEKLELKKGDLATQEEGKLDINKYLELIQEEGMVEESDITQNHEESYDVTVENKYVFLVEKEANGNIKIEYLGKAGNITPIIDILATSSTSNSATIKFKLKYAKRYRVLIKKQEESEYAEREKSEVNNNEVSCLLENLEQGEEYTIKIEAEAEKGAKAEKETEITTITIEDLTIANCTFSYSPDDWTKESVTATAEVKNIDIEEKGYTLQTSKNGKDWFDTLSQTFTKNGTVYARLVDSTGQEGGTTTGNIEKIDKQKPVVTDKTTATTNQITINATDEASGIVGYTVTESNNEPNSFTGCKNIEELSINIESKTQGTTYYVWVKDQAGNISAYKQVTTRTVPTPSITIADETTWTSSGKSVTLSTVNGYITKYTTDGSMPSATKGITYSAAFTINNNNTKITAIYVDSTNQVGGSATKTVNKIDLANPKEASITIGGDKTQNALPVTLTAKVTHQDNDGGSGVNIKLCKYKLNTSNVALGTTASNYDTDFSSDGQTIEIKPNTVESWYLHVLTVDNVGKATETIKGPIEITANYHTHGGQCYKSVQIPGSIRMESSQWGDGTYDNRYYCTVCGQMVGRYGRDGGWGQTSGTHCSRTETQLNCTKSTTSIDSYTITYE